MYPSKISWSGRAWALFALGCTVATTLGLDWPQWGGPQRDHISRETGLLQAWPKEGPKQVWLYKNAGLGYAGVAVAQGKLFTMGAREGRERLLALDAATGQELWSLDLDEILKNDWGDGPRGTPTVEGGRVFALSGKGTLVAANAADGKQLWSKSMTALGGIVQHWGYTESVLVENGKVYCTPGGPNGTLAAFDAATGELQWQSKELKNPAQYASIMPVNLNGKRQLIQLLMTNLVSVNAENGALLWQTGWPGRVAVIPTPIVRDNLIYITTGYGVGCKLVRVSPDNKPSDVYENKVMKNHHGGVVLLGDHVYGYSDGPGWVCQKFETGEEVWASKKLGKGAMTAVGGRLYCLDEGTGEVALIEASSKGWEEHGRFTLAPQTTLRAPRGKIWMHPVIANGKLFLRDQELLFCFDVAAK